MRPSVEAIGRPSTSRLPPGSGGRSPATMLNSVLLPHPLGPTMVTNSPSATSRKTGCSTGTRRPSTSNVFAICRSVSLSATRLAHHLQARRHLGPEAGVHCLADWNRLRELLVLEQEAHRELCRLRVEIAEPLLLARPPCHQLRHLAQHDRLMVLLEIRALLERDVDRFRLVLNRVLPAPQA